MDAVAGKDSYSVKMPPPMNELRLSAITNLSLEDMPDEEWFPLNGVEKFYEISKNYSRVKRLPRMVGRESYPRPAAIQKQQYCDGYLCVCITDENGHPRKAGVHQLMGQFLEKTNDAQNEVNHINGIRHDDRLENLEWTTCRGNSQHASKTGLQKSFKGRSNNAKVRTKLPRMIFTEDELASELWIPVSSHDGVYKGIYEVSNLGNVRSLDKYVNITLRDGRPWKRVIKGKLLRGNPKKDGYTYVTLYDDNANKIDISIQRLVALNFLPNPGNKPEVNHKDFITNNNRVENLEWNTFKENYDHAKKAGKIFVRTGELTSTAVLKEWQVLEIREAYAAGKYSFVYLGEMYGVSSQSISGVVKRKTWKHLLPQTA